MNLQYLTPVGQFFCKKCKQHKPVSDRAGKYGPCKECKQ